MHIDQKPEHAGFKWAVVPVFIRQLPWKWQPWESWGEICISKVACYRQEETVPKFGRWNPHFGSSRQISQHWKQLARAELARQVRQNNKEQEKHPVWGQRGSTRLIEKVGWSGKAWWSAGKQWTTHVQQLSAQRGDGTYAFYVETPFSIPIHLCTVKSQSWGSLLPSGQYRVRCTKDVARFLGTLLFL